MFLKVLYIKDIEGLEKANLDLQDNLVQYTKRTIKDKRIDQDTIIVGIKIRDSNSVNLQLNKIGNNNSKRGVNIKQRLSDSKTYRARLIANQYSVFYRK